jgi:hypothetical protein
MISLMVQTSYKVLTQVFVDIIKKRVKKVVAAVLPASPISEEMVSTSTAPIAAVMAAALNPITYMPPSTFCVIEGDSDESISKQPSVVASIILPHVTTDGTLMVPINDIAPLTVSHLFWNCIIDGVAVDFPMTVKALIDHGAHAVLISNDLIKSLALKHHSLIEPMLVEMAMPDVSRKKIVFLLEWVKL